MNQPSEIKLPHDDFSVVPYAWTWVEFALIGLALLVAVFLVYFMVSLYRRWRILKNKDSRTPLELLRFEAMHLQIDPQEPNVNETFIYGELSRILRKGIDIFYKTSLSAWNFEEISSQSDLLSSYIGSSSHRVLSFLGRADRSIYSGVHVEAEFLKLDKKLVIDTIDDFCRQEQKRLEAKK